MTERVAMALHNTDSLCLLALSLLLASLSWYLLLDMVRRIGSARNLAWFGLAVIATGTGSWVTQVTGIRAFLPNDVTFRIYWPNLALSLLVSITASSFIALLTSRKLHRTITSLAGSIFFGSSFLLGLYFNLEALSPGAALTYSSPQTVLLALPVIAIAFWSLYNTLAPSSPTPGKRWQVPGEAFLLGIALVSAQCLGLASTPVEILTVPRAVSRYTVSASAFDTGSFLLLSIAVFVFLVAAAVLDRHISSHAQDSQLNDERRRALEALGEQRAMRMQNQALVEEILERKKVEAKLHQMAFHDSLTGLRNRPYFLDVVSDALTQVRNRKVSCAAVLYIDLDNFKVVNDMLGHRQGDLLLVEMAQRLERYKRKHDTPARIGGDVFTFLLSDLQDMEHAVRIARRILDIIEEPVLLAETLLPVSASIGICRINAEYGEAEEILRNADTAMYCAKRNGGSCCLVYDPSMHEDSMAALQMKLEFRSALEKREFEVYYQPLVDMRDRSITGVEALLRWNHPGQGLVSPAKFIPLAEETGHIVAIGSWATRQACIDMQQIQKAFGEHLLLSVNASSRQLEEPSFFSDLSSIINETGIDPRTLQVEITESIFIKDADRIGTLFQKIRDLGVRIAFDDFGTGYSSLSYLAKYPIDTLKIDQSFVQNMQKGSVNSDIVQLVISMSHTIGMKVSAEGVEEPEQAAALIDLGCNIAQGYLYSRPVSLNELMMKFHNWPTLPIPFRMRRTGTSASLI